jgi:hypothetical protein
MRGKDLALILFLLWLLGRQRTTSSGVTWSWINPETGATVPGDLPADSAVGTTWCDPQTGRCWLRTTDQWIEV